MQTTEKTCFKCNLSKNISCFYKHKHMKDGHLNKCIECAKNDVHIHRNLNLEKIQAYDRDRGALPHRRYLSSKICIEYRKNNPNRYKATTYIQNAIKKGVIERLPCEICGAINSHAHHSSYSEDMWLYVTWLCSIHHKAAHSIK